MRSLRHLKVYLAVAVSLVSFSPGCDAQERTRVRTGAEVLLDEQIGILDGKRVGLITNQTGELHEGGSLAEALVKKGVRLVALFSPEHGFRGSARAGESVEDSDDPLTGIPVFSLYGETKKPTAAMMDGIDILLYDVQDVGVRFYTYISTMGLAIEAADAHNIPFVVLDRPNPLGGIRIEGPVMEDSLRSFVGRYPIPVVYGLTCGELATMIAGERWMETRPMPDVRVIRMDGWSRSMLWEQTGLRWIRPSPNITDPETALIYPATCLIEATRCSEGRGTPAPFRTIGAPFIDPDTLSIALSITGFRGLDFAPVRFIPESSKHAGRSCGGVSLSVTDHQEYSAASSGVRLLVELQRRYRSDIGINEQSLQRLLGASRPVDLLLDGAPWEEIEPHLQKGVSEFTASAIRYRLYE